MKLFRGLFDGFYRGSIGVILRLGLFHGLVALL